MLALARVVRAVVRRAVVRWPPRLRPPEPTAQTVVAAIAAIRIRLISATSRAVMAGVVGDTSETALAQQLHARHADPWALQRAVHRMGACRRRPHRRARCRAAACAVPSASRSPRPCSPPATATARTASGAPAPAPRRTGACRRRASGCSRAPRSCARSSRRRAAEAVLRRLRLGALQRRPVRRRGGRGQARRARRRPGHPARSTASSCAPPSPGSRSPTTVSPATRARALEPDSGSGQRSREA